MPPVNWEVGSAALMSFIRAYAVIAQNSFLLHTNLTQTAAIFRMPSSDILKKIHFRVGTFTTGDVLEARLEGVDLVNGAPSASLVVPNAKGTVDVTGGNAFYSVNINGANGVSIPRGTLVALVLKFPARIDGYFALNHSNNITQTFPYSATYSSSWAKSPNGPMATIEFESGIHFIPGMFPATYIQQISMDQYYNPDRCGNQFQFPGAKSVSLRGVMLNINHSADIELTVYDKDGYSILLQETLDRSVKSSSTGTTVLWMFPADLVLDGGLAVYRIVMRATNASLQYSRMTFMDILHMRQLGFDPESIMTKYCYFNGVPDAGSAGNWGAVDGQLVGLLPIISNVELDAPGGGISAGRIMGGI
ncbi:MAG: hypothetical protein OHK006_13160 [Thermodesulfovibrionales bacterium]